MFRSPPKPSWAMLCHALAHLGFVLAYLCHDPILALSYALSICGDVLELFGRHRVP